MNKQPNATPQKLQSFPYIMEQPQGENLKCIVILDQLGRIAIPKAVLDKNEIIEKQSLFIFFDKPSLVIKKSEYGYEDCFYAERKIDSLGRIVIPIEMRRQLKMEADSKLSLYTTDDGEIVVENLPANW